MGRRIRRATIAAAALGADDNILEVEVSTPGADVNAPLAFDWDELLAGVGTPDFQPLPDNMTVHLFGAPRLEIVTVNTQAAAGSWM